MRISIVVPVFNEEDAVPIFFQALGGISSFSEYDLEVIFVDDGSQDGTKQIVKEIATEEVRYKVELISFSRNFGKESALFAGIEYAKGDVVIPMDVDLQDPLDLIPEMIRLHLQGADVVLAKRVNRDSDSFLKRTTANLFYKLHNKISTPKIEENVGDFRLMSRKAVEAIKLLPEKKIFMKGLLGWVGFKTETIEYTRQARSAGTTKFNGWKLWNFAIEGITSFSTVPLRVWTYLGATIALLAFIFAIKIFIEKVFFGNPISGYPSLMVSILFIGGVQLIGIGVLGEYLGRVYEETKNRPRYIVEEIFTGKSDG